MTIPPSQTFHEKMSKWASIIGAAMLVAYGSHPALTFLLEIINGDSERVGNFFMPLFMTGLGSVFAIAAYALMRKPSPSLRFEAATLWSGLMMWVTIPLMILIIWLEARLGTRSGQDSATAAFFMLMIFGGYCAIIGTIMLIVSRVMRRRRLDAALKMPWL